MNWILKHKRPVIDTGIALAILGFFVFTQEAPGLEGALQGLILMVVFFACVPLFWHIVLQKESLARFGLTWNQQPKQLLYSIGVFLFAYFLFLALWSFLGVIHENVSLPIFAQLSFRGFLTYEFVIVPVVLLLLDLFFRGFIQIRILATWPTFLAAVAQALSFIIFLWLTGSLDMSMFTLIFMAIVGGIVTSLTRSLYLSFLVQWFLMIALDVTLLILNQ